MQSKDWKQLKEILNDVLELEQNEREVYLSRLEAKTRDEIESLLAFENESEDAMKLTAVEFSKDFFDNAEAYKSLAGQLIGNYKIVREIGIGGMGAVYLAERNDGKFEQQVALKMLKREYNIEKIRRNFARETEIQSKLNHPNIARLLDSGTTDDGIPFLVMEFVEGLPIDKYCDEKNPSLVSRLKLFNKVCEAVAHAHRNLIVHRDLKPSNILVTENGEPKLLDFGISKLLDTENSDENNATTAFGAMTPEYASPEQIKGENVTTATDVYSLGVVLYKILTGRHPFEIKGKKKSALIKTIIETEPTKPSAVSNDKEKKTPSAVRSPQLKGDIDNIILKALSKETAGRYQTVEQFSTDIWRFIDGLPVTARASTFTYRANKFFRRNKIAVASSILILISLLAGISVAFWQAREASAKANIAMESQKIAQIETEKAKAEQAKSEKITGFMSKIIGYANPAWYAEGAKYGGDARVIDAIEDLSDQIDIQFANEPEVAAELHHKFGESIGWSSKTESNIERQNKLKEIYRFHILRALELRKKYYGEWHELVAKDLFYAYPLITNDPNERASLLMRAILMMRDTNPQNLNLPYMLEAYTAGLIMPKYDDNQESYRRAVQPPTNENRFQIAEKMLRESLPIYRLHYKTDNRAIYTAECKLSYTLVMQEKWTEFYEHYEICKQYGESSNQMIAPESLKWYVDWIEKAVAEKRK